MHCLLNESAEVGDPKLTGRLKDAVKEAGFHPFTLSSSACGPGLPSLSQSGYRSPRHQAHTASTQNKKSREGKRDLLLLRLSPEGGKAFPEAPSRSTYIFVQTGSHVVLG